MSPAAHREPTDPLPMVAVDLAEALAHARDEYAPDLPDVDSDDVLAVLPEFLASLRSAR